VKKIAYLIDDGRGLYLSTYRTKLADDTTAPSFTSLLSEAQQFIYFAQAKEVANNMPGCRVLMLGTMVVTKESE
jgi:hypothetical protein